MLKIRTERWAGLLVRCKERRDIIIDHSISPFHSGNSTPTAVVINAISSLKSDCKAENIET